MTGGGMDLSPYLLATFVNLGKGIPKELADSISKTWNAYIDIKEHQENCKLLANAYIEQADRDLMRAVELGEVDDNIKRHIKGLQKEYYKNND